MTKLSFVIPCYNERDGAPKLLAALEETRRALGPSYQWELIFVDDGSVDGTSEILDAACRGSSEARVVHHPRNRGLGAALRTGFEHATGELVATTDSDCTYDPRELVQMLKLMQQGADVVVASPYHPDGGVKNVPAYRLLLSRNLSRLYRWVTGSHLYTYTSLFRVYRGEVLRAVRFQSEGFLSMAEILAEALLLGYRVVEHPMWLTVRQYGESKAAIFRLIRDHVGFLWRLLRKRARVSPLTAALAPGSPAVPNLVEWNQRLNESHGMAILESHPNFLVRLHERGRKHRILDMIRSRSSDVIAEVGCERGTLSEKLSRSCRYLVCVDIDHKVLLDARARVTRVNGGRAGFVVADAQRLPFRDGWADISVSTHTLEHLPDPVQGLGELARITRSDGRLVINVPNDRWMLVLKRIVFGVLGFSRFFRGINVGLAPGHLWVFHPGLLRQISRNHVSLGTVSFNPPFFTNMFVTARPLGKMEMGNRTT